MYQHTWKTEVWFHWHTANLRLYTLSAGLELRETLEGAIFLHKWLLVVLEFRWTRSSNKFNHEPVPILFGNIFHKLACCERFSIECHIYKPLPTLAFCAKISLATNKISNLWVLQILTRSHLVSQSCLLVQKKISTDQEPLSGFQEPNSSKLLLNSSPDCQPDGDSASRNGASVSYDHSKLNFCT